MRKSRRQYERERLEAYSELWDFLGRDALGTRITKALVREGWVHLPGDSADVSTVEGLRAAYVDEHGRDYLADIRGIGVTAMARIAERCTQTDS